MSYQDKYLKYKNKYLKLKSIIQSGGMDPNVQYIPEDRPNLPPFRLYPPSRLDPPLPGIVLDDEDELIADFERSIAQRRAGEDAPMIQVPQFNFAQIILEKQRIITETNNAIVADTTVSDNIDLNSRGCDMIMTGCATGDNAAANFDVSIQSFMTDEDNINNTIVIKIIDTPTTSRIFLINRANLQTVLTDSTVYPCLQANNMPGRDSNVITDLPLYSLANIVGTRVLIKREILDAFLQIPGNLFLVVSRHIYSYPSIASHNVVFNGSSLISGLHCNTGSVAETLWNIRRVNIP